MSIPNIKELIFDANVTIPIGVLNDRDQRALYKIFNSEVIPISKAWLCIFIAAHALGLTGTTLALVFIFGSQNIIIGILSFAFIASFIVIRVINVALLKRRQKRYHLWLRHVKGVRPN